MRKTDPNSLRSRVRRLLKANGHMTMGQIARTLGCTPQQAKNASHAVRFPERQSGYALTARRKAGQRPNAVVFAERRAEAQRIARPILTLRRKSKSNSFSTIGAALGLTRNQVAGRVWRAQRTNPLFNVSLGSSAESFRCRRATFRPDT